MVIFPVYFILLPFSANSPIPFFPVVIAVFITLGVPAVPCASEYIPIA